MEKSKLRQRVEALMKEGYPRFVARANALAEEKLAFASGVLSKLGKDPITSNLLLVEWCDSRQVSSGWITLAEAVAAEPSTIHSVGYLIKSTDESLTIAQSVGADHINGAICIPKACITKVTNL